MEVTDGADDLGLITDGVLDPDGVRGVTFVINVLGSGGAFVGVTESLVSVDRAAVEVIDAELGVNFESGRGPDGILSGLFDSCVGVTGAVAW
jgi:hypothetical protein